MPSTARDSVRSKQNIFEDMIYFPVHPWCADAVTERARVHTRYSCNDTYIDIAIDRHIRSSDTAKHEIDKLCHVTIREGTC